MVHGKEPVRIKREGGSKDLPKSFDVHAEKYKGAAVALIRESRGGERVDLSTSQRRPPLSGGRGIQTACPYTRRALAKEKHGGSDGRRRIKVWLVRGNSGRIKLTKGGRSWNVREKKG